MQGLYILVVAAVTASIAPVHVRSVPALSGKTGLNIVAESQGGVTFNGDGVVVPDNDQVAQLLGAREGGGLNGYAFLHTPVTGDHVDVVVKN